MSVTIAFSTAGKVPFKVSLVPTAIALSRFAKAVFRAGGIVSDTRTSPTYEAPWVAVVWLRTTSVPLFESLCLPMEFVLLSNEEVQAGKF